MANRCVEKPSGNFGQLAQLQILEAQKANQPTFGDKALMIAAASLNAGISYKSNRDALQMQYQDKQNEREQKMILAGYTPYNEQGQYKDYLGGWKPYQSGGQEAVPMGQRDYAIASQETKQQFTPQNEDVVEVGGKKWIRPKKEAKPDKIYTRAYLVKDPPGQKPGWYEQRNITNATTQKTEPIFTPFSGTPAQAQQREKAIADEMGKLTPIEQERLKWLKEQKKRFYDPDTKTYNEAGWAKFLKEKNNNPKLRAILEIDSQPIELDETLGNDPTKPNWGD